MRALLTLGILMLLAPASRAATASDPPAGAPRWSGTFYVGRFFNDALLDILFTDALVARPRFMDSHVVTLSLARNLTTWGRYAAWEAEGQLGKHWGLQGHLEVNAAIVFRWLPFPWDRVLDTSFAIGEGVSYATASPFAEADLQGEPGFRLLNYLLIETAVALPRAPVWSLTARIHHRSGVFGLYGTGEGSNFLGLGLRRHF